LSGSTPWISVVFSGVEHGFDVKGGLKKSKGFDQ
jgi:hypothetical protein